MSASKKPMAGDSAEDDAPDLSTPEWREKFSHVETRRGRPPAELTKISTTIRLDADIIEAFRAGGAGWQSRINAALREWLRSHSIDPKQG
jgi:uncharacterized protein (DUF4415 family)